jgi:hypothetical protein
MSSLVVGFVAFARPEQERVLSWFEKRRAFGDSVADNLF